MERRLIRLVLVAVFLSLIVTLVWEANSTSAQQQTLKFTKEKTPAHYYNQRPIPGQSNIQSDAAFPGSILPPQGFKANNLSPITNQTITNQTITNQTITNQTITNQTNTNQTNTNQTNTNQTTNLPKPDMAFPGSILPPEALLPSVLSK